MTRRVVGIVAAVLMAAVGTAALAAYVNSAEARALAGEELVEVYVADALIPAGTAAEEIEQFITVERVPLKVKARGAVESLPALAGTVTAVDLLPGEQLISARFVQRSEFSDRELGVDVPDDMVEVTVELEPQRAAGGLLEPGQLVMVMASFDPFELSRTVIPVDGEAVPLPSAVADDVSGKTPNVTDDLLRKVLVTAVQDRAGTNADEEQQRLTIAPEGTVFVTLAVTPRNANRLVFAAEFGQVWLAIERETVAGDDEPAQTRGNVLNDSGDVS
ncbi:MAG: RcpC/CpaB family pilus assembly protein [Actinomycetota bacterium]